MVQAQNVYDIPKRSYFSFEDTSFVSGDSPVTHDINADISRNAQDGYLSVDGAGDVQFNISADGTNFDDAIIVKQGETFSLEGLDIDSIKATWVANSAYRVFAL